MPGDQLDCDNSRSQIIMNKKKFIETVATIVADSQLALARRPQQECPFKHPQKPSKSFFNIESDEKKSEVKGKGKDTHLALIVAGAVVISSIVRFLLEWLVTLVLSPLREHIDWEKYWSDSDCGSKEGTREKLICKAYQICIQELVPSLVPLSVDDFLIQILLFILMALVFDQYTQEAPNRGKHEE